MKSKPNLRLSRRPISGQRHLHVCFPVTHQKAASSLLIYRFLPAKIIHDPDREAPMKNVSRKVFQIGFNKCGTKFLTELFHSNGYKGIHWAAGALADDIAYSKAVNRRPLAKWADEYTVFTDMESVHRFSMPMIEGFKEYALLDKWYPDAIFVLNIRKVDDWILGRVDKRDSPRA